MKWILYVYLVTSNGVTESLSDFDTIEQCQKAEQHLHETWARPSSKGFGDLVALQTECQYVD
jgi:hypothetical protein